MQLLTYIASYSHYFKLAIIPQTRQTAKINSLPYFPLHGDIFFTTPDCTWLSSRQIHCDKMQKHFKILCW